MSEPSCGTPGIKADSGDDPKIAGEQLAAGAPVHAPTNRASCVGTCHLRIYRIDLGVSRSSGANEALLVSADANVMSHSSIWINNSKAVFG
jgi:hypothetical protein